MRRVIRLPKVSSTSAKQNALCLNREKPGLHKLTALIKLMISQKRTVITAVTKWWLIAAGQNEIKELGCLCRAQLKD